MYEKNEDVHAYMNTYFGTVNNLYFLYFWMVENIYFNVCIQYIYI